jgi:hypothetical protein
MKVHPAISMKTKEREKYTCQVSGKMPGGRGRKPAECRRGHDSNFWLLTPGFCSSKEESLSLREMPMEATMFMKMQGLRWKSVDGAKIVSC